MERSLREIMRRHEALRTVFRIEGDSPAQVILPPSVRLPLVDLGGLSAPVREVCEPPEKQRSSQTDLPAMVAPAASIRLTMVASRSGV